MFSDASSPLSLFAGQILPGIGSVPTACLQPAREHVCQLAAGISGPVLLLNLPDQESARIPAHGARYVFPSEMEDRNDLFYKLFTLHFNH